MYQLNKPFNVSYLIGFIIHSVGSSTVLSTWSDSDCCCSHDSNSGGNSNWYLYDSRHDIQLGLKNVRLTSRRKHFD